MPAQGGEETSRPKHKRHEMGVCAPMGYCSIRISRERDGYEVHATDPAIQAKNDARKGDGPSEAWQDPDVEYTFDTKEQVLAFLDKAMDIALPAETFTSAFDKFAKEAQGKS